MKYLFAVILILPSLFSLAQSEEIKTVDGDCYLYRWYPTEQLVTKNLTVIPEPRKVKIPLEYRIDTTYVEAVPVGRPSSNAPKEYKMVLDRVPLPCEGEVGEDGDCYIWVTPPVNPITETSMQEIPCKYTSTEDGRCYERSQVVCEETLSPKLKNKIRKMLIKKGYDAGSKSEFNSKTMEALSAFQKAEGLSSLSSKYLSVDLIQALGLAKFCK